MPESNIIFGKRTVFEALENDVQIDKVYIDRDNQFMENIKRKVHEKSIQISFVPIEKLNRLTKGNHQGIVATISPIKTLDLNSLEKNKEDVLLFFTKTILGAVSFSIAYYKATITSRLCALLFLIFLGDQKECCVRRKNNRQKQTWAWLSSV